ncbi:MAG: hypothetical protein PHR26_03975 [Candidatus ainarchaeum sp.]|nr:hypothetical protein [Candidatus ainarchaeum sp.]MDD3975976.1 hypothetical protein [Candidatus ainarchaeum sp.]
MVFKKKISKSKINFNKSISKKKVFFRSKFFNLLIILIILILFLFLISILNLNNEEKVINQNIFKHLDSSSPQQDIDNFLNKLLNNNNEYIIEYSSNLNDVISINQIEQANIDSLKKRYFFLFSEDVLDEYSFKYPVIGDYIVEYDSAIIVYNYNLDVVKSFFIVQAISN